MAAGLVDCVGAVVHDAHGRLLLVRRGTEPARGTWSVPGGRVEAGETDAAATVREVREETGLDVEVGRLLGSVLRDAPAGGRYLIRDYLCRPAPGSEPDAVRAGDDAAGVGWFGAGDLADLVCAPGLVDALAQWGVLPQPGR